MATEDGTQGTATETATQTATAPKSAAQVSADSQSKREAIMARFRGGAGAVAAAAAPADTGAAGDDADDTDTDTDTEDEAAKAAAAKAKTETPADGETTARIADLSRQVRELTDQLTDAKGKIPAEDKYAALMERVKSDPLALLDEFAESGVTLEAISSAFLAREQNPAHKELTAQQKEIAELKKWREDREKAEKDAATKAASDRETEAGRTAVKTMVEADKARWPVVTAHADNTTEAVADAIAAARLVAKQLGRRPSAAEAEKILGDCLDEVEKVQAARGARYRKPDIAPAATSHRSIATPAGGTAGAPRAAAPPKKLTTQDIVARVRRASQPKS